MGGFPRYFSIMSIKPAITERAKGRAAIAPATAALAWPPTKLGLGIGR